jgi:hypothetical protein
MTGRGDLTVEGSTGSMCGSGGEISRFGADMVRCAAEAASTD